MVMGDFAIRPLSPVLGAKVGGLDLTQPLDAAARSAVYDAFVRYHVLCFRDQRLDKKQQIAFAEQFGTLERHIARNRGSDNPLVHTVSNLGADGSRAARSARRSGTPTSRSARNRRWRQSFMP
jgi:alpha-ketoglutarate-dependent taurine dioxygenase